MRLGEVQRGHGGDVGDIPAIIVSIYNIVGGVVQTYASNWLASIRR